ncbi:MAG: glycosyltransferase [Planctomycetota bacterium]|jgi:glycosyltransferase involved in cell wall biosynthesis
MTTLLTIDDRSFATREHTLLRRLEVGFADEGWHVLHAAPESLASHAQGSFADVIEYDPPGPFASTRWRASRLIDRIDSLGLSEMPSIIHAWGEQSWGLALHTAAMLAIPAVFEVWASRLVPTLKRWERRVMRTHTIGPILWSTPSSQLLREIDHADTRFPSRNIHWGTYAEPLARVNTRSDQRALAILSTGLEPASTCAVLKAIASIRSDFPRLVVLLDEAAVAHHHRQVWGTIRATDLTDCTTIVSGMETRRDIVMQADVLIQPEATGEVRSVTLDALAHAMLVLARRDPSVDTLTGDAPPIVVDDSSQRGWEQALSVALNDHHREERRAVAGRRFIAEHRTVSSHVSQLLEIYDGLFHKTDEPL